ncbi:hypothetical protein [Prauserella endophytica]|uniref:Small secreted hydrophilic protein n=1 Tax=Prauserella endophytica TaxID=1592324 RepID=A0ABY2S4N3_9PSEU|nr:hypothetical protein [Prauserella endophytica]PXY23500.1 hypothetical protein BAY59_27955 [Prauserella coralliicola]TKG70513.1 hypothetical protein FCN18_16620 [Prauserella endophytica]
MRIRTLAGLAIAGASAAAIAGGVALADTPGSAEEPTVRIVQESQPDDGEDCPSGSGQSSPEQEL